MMTGRRTRQIKVSSSGLKDREKLIPVGFWYVGPGLILNPAPQAMKFPLEPHLDGRDHCSFWLLFGSLRVVQIETLVWKSTSNQGSVVHTFEDLFFGAWVYGDLLCTLDRSRDEQVPTLRNSG